MRAVNHSKDKSNDLYNDTISKKFDLCLIYPIV